MKKALIISLSLAMLTACGLTKKDLGLEKTLPDASTSKAQEELVLPPNYNLRPVVPMAHADINTNKTKEL
ncbi:MAG: hypothetical protein J6Y53_03465 [Alphaproteobacteria bacterium]|nr:hypothetical protein [Alphaproteobacteria bacterium]